MYKVLSKGDKRTKRKKNEKKQKEEEEKKRGENKVDFELAQDIREIF